MHLYIYSMITMVTVYYSFLIDCSLLQLNCNNLIDVFISDSLVTSKMKSYSKQDGAYLYASVPRAIHRACYRSEVEK